MALRGLLALGILLGAFGAGANWQKQRSDAKRLQAVEAAREKEANWQTDVAALVEVKDDETRRLTAALDAARRELRNRAPERMPAASAAACAGASPAALSAPDADVALGLAAEADRLRADLQACRGWIEAVTR